MIGLVCDCDGDALRISVVIYSFHIVAIVVIALVSNGE